MRSLHLPLGALALLLSAAPACAQSSPFYVEGDVGAVLRGRTHAVGTDAILGPVDIGERFRHGWIASAGVGRTLGDGPASIEAEGVYLSDRVRSPDLDAALGIPSKIRAKAYGATLGVKLEPKPVALGAGLGLSPFVGLGVGYGHTDFRILGDHYTGNGLLWQAKAGAAVQVTPALAWTLAYRYVHIPTYDTNKLGLNARFKTHAQAVTVGVRYRFGG
jgi:opacity protein-like surface antigen